MPADSPSSPAALRRHGTFTALSCGLIALAVFVVYANSRSVPLLWDDLPSIAENPTIARLGTALSPPVDSPVGGRPLINLSFALNHALNGEDVRGYHAGNVLVHALAALALFGVVRRTLLRPVLPGRLRAEATGLALAVAAIWAVHPAQTESVTYLTQRAESLMGLFYLLTLYGFIRAVDSTGHPVPLRGVFRWLFLSILACLLGAMCKETIVTAPAIILLYDRTFAASSLREAWRRRWGYYLGLAGSWLLLAGLMSGLNRRGAGFGLGVTGWDYALTSCRSVALYLKLAFWPHPLVFDYGPVFVHGTVAAVPSAVVLAVALAGVVWALWRRPAVGFAGACFFIILSPTSSVIPLAGQPTAEHRLYLPLAAIVVLAVLGLHAWLGRRSLPVFLAAVLGLGWASARRNEDYRSALVLWSDTAAKCPDNPRAHSNLGNELAKVPERVPEALAQYQEALRIESDFADGRRNFAAVLAKIPGRMPEAIAQYEEVLRIEPDSAEAHCDLAVELAKFPGQTQETLAEYEAALRIRPDYVKAHNNLALLLANLPGRLPEAIAQYEAALRIAPDNAEVQNNLAVACARSGRFDEAIVHFEAALRLDPTNGRVRDNLNRIEALRR